MGWEGVLPMNSVVHFGKDVTFSLEIYSQDKGLSFFSTSIKIHMNDNGSLRMRCMYSTYNILTYQTQAHPQTKDAFLSSSFSLYTTSRIRECSRPKFV